MNSPSLRLEVRPRWMNASNNKNVSNNKRTINRHELPPNYHIAQILLTVCHFLNKTEKMKQIIGRGFTKHLQNYVRKSKGNYTRIAKSSS